MVSILHTKVHGSRGVLALGKGPTFYVIIKG